MEDYTLYDRRSLARLMHPSTATALEALGALPEASSALDLGCGGGLLNLTMARQWPEARIVAVDISPRAVEDARATVSANGLTERIEVVRSEGYSHASVKAGAPYDVIVANLLAEMHVRYAGDAASHLRQGGALIAAGILQWLKPQVEAAYADKYWKKIAEYRHGDWVALVYEKKK